MRILIPTDASLKIGAGHVMHCLTLADILRSRGAQIELICREHHENFVIIIESRGFRVTISPRVRRDVTNSSWLGCDWKKDAQDFCLETAVIFGWIVVDHYELYHRWVRPMRSRCVRIMCVDDLANRLHDWVLLLDQIIGRSAEDYVGLVAKQSQLLLSSQYALWRLEFAKLRAASLVRRRTLQLLKNGILATNAFYPSIMHKNEHVELFSKTLQPILENVEKVQHAKASYDELLDSTICHAGFKRLN